MDHQNAQQTKVADLMPTWLFLSPLARFSDLALLVLRIAIGSFLIWGVLDNIVSQERMDEFVDFLTKFNFPAPELMARVSVWAQFFVGIFFVAGLLTRWAGLICAANFIVAIVMVDRFGGLRGAFPALCLVLIGFYLATQGAGRFSLDALVARRTDV
jgi:putative oxidoreductase